MGQLCLSSAPRTGLTTYLMRTWTTISCTTRRCSRWLAPSSGRMGAGLEGCVLEHQAKSSVPAGAELALETQPAGAGAAKARALPTVRRAVARRTPCHHCRCGLRQTCLRSCSRRPTPTCLCTSGAAVGPCPLGWLRAGTHVTVVCCTGAIKWQPPFPSTCVHRSCYEIYGGKVYDLLNGRKKLEVREDGRKRVQVGQLEGRRGPASHDSTKLRCAPKKGMQLIAGAQVWTAEVAH